MVVSTYYSHKTGFDQIIELIKSTYPKSEINFSKVDMLDIAEINISGGFLRATSRLKISYRQRLEPSHQLTENDMCPLTPNLIGLHGFISNIPAQNAHLKVQLLNKIQTINSEFSVIQESGITKNLNKLLESMASTFQAILFVQPTAIIAKAETQHFLDDRLNLILDMHGKSEIKELYFEIDSKYVDNDQDEVPKDQEEQKLEIPGFRTENLTICSNAGYKPADSLPTEWDRKLRPSLEIALRINAIKAIILWLMVPQENLPDDKILEFINQNKLRDFMTEDEVQILSSTRDDENMRNSIGWKFENAWSLAWYFGFKEPEITGVMMSGELMSEIMMNHSCPLDVSVNEWVIKQTTRAEEEVIAKEDLFYCLHNAARSAQMGGKTVPDGFDPMGSGGVIHERRHSLTWILSSGIEWDDTDLST